MRDIRPGDVYCLTAQQPTGHEQRGRRPVMVVSDSRLSPLGMAWVVPLTSTDRNWPTHARLHINGNVSIAMCEQLRAVDIERLTDRHASVSYDELMDVRAILRSLIG